MSQRRQKSATRPSWPLLAFGIVLLMSGLGSAASSGAQAESRQDTAYDYFTTNPEKTFFDFTGEFILPAGFFDRGSSSFEGRVPFQGVPIRTFQGRRVGDTDTVVARIGTPKLGPSYPSRGTAEIELVVLSLASSEPIKVKAGKKDQLWDVKLQLSKRRPARGKITIVQENAEGGIFDSEFMVFPVLTFVRRGDGAKRVMDIGAMKLGAEGTQKMTLHATAVPWSTQAPREVVKSSDAFHPGVAQGRLLQGDINHHSHSIRPARIEE